METVQHDSEVVLTGAILLEELLLRVIDVRLPGTKNAKRKLTKSSENQAALALLTGLISEQQYQKLRIVTGVRNVFAHKYPRPSLDGDNRIKAALSSLPEYKASREQGLTNREIYRRTVTDLAAYLQGWLTEGARGV